MHFQFTVASKMDAFNYNDKSYELFIKSNKEYTPFPGGMGKYYFDGIKKLIAQDDDCIAQIDAVTDTKQTYKELLSASIKLAQYLRSINIQPGDHMNLCSYNHVNATVVVIAAQFVGAILSATDPIQSVEDLKHLLNIIKPKIVFVSDGSENAIKMCLDDLDLASKVIMVSHSVDNEFETVDDILENTTVDEDFEPYFAEDLNGTCSIFFSSGTTGMAKAICLSHNFLHSRLSGFPKKSVDCVILNYASFYWISCLFVLALSIQSGSARLLCRTFEKSTHWQIVAKYKVTYAVLANTYFIEARKYLDVDANAHLPDLKTIVYGGGPVPMKDINYYIEKLPKVHVSSCYALTEGGYVSHYKLGDKLGSNGKPAANNQTIKIVDPDTERSLPLKEIGEIRIKQQYQMTGYYEMDSRDAWDSQGFLKTGDLGYMDEDFNLFVVDRIKEMFKYRSWHVVPAKIETLLSTHPDVVHAVVIGKPTHDEDENHAMAIVNLREGSGTTSLELQNFVNDRMDKINQIRAGVIIVDTSGIPITPTGKVNRRLLKMLYAK